tara:strand:+ start:7457 stop:7651 length:195 start_codon:yes stop_codon:yes gene_type:complete
MTGSGVLNTQDHTSPWVIPNDANAALADPDLYAWQTFIALNWHADIDSKTADSSKALGADGTVV